MEPASTPNESFEMGVMNSFSEDPGGVAGVKGVRMLREAVLDLPEGVSGASQMSLEAAGDDEAETVDAGDNHENFFESSEERESSPSPMNIDSGWIAARNLCMGGVFSVVIRSCLGI
jgi:hypothetical protein